MTIAAGTVALNYGKLRRGFVDTLIDNDEKVDSFKKHTKFMIRVLKPNP